MGAVNALARESKVRVLSSPSVLVLDNQTASIKVGDQQPVFTGSLIHPMEWFSLHRRRYSTKILGFPCK